MISARMFPPQLPERRPRLSVAYSNCAVGEQANVKWSIVLIVVRDLRAFLCDETDWNIGDWVKRPCSAVSYCLWCWCYLSRVAEQSRRCRLGAVAAGKLLRLSTVASSRVTMAPFCVYESCNRHLVCGGSKCVLAVWRYKCSYRLDQKMAQFFVRLNHIKYWPIFKVFDCQNHGDNLW